MPFNGSGGFDLLNPQAYPVVGNDIDATAYTQVLQDIAAALESLLSRMGENAMSADLNMGGYSLVSAEDGSFNGVVTAAQLRIAGIVYDMTQVLQRTSLARFGTIVGGTLITAAGTSKLFQSATDSVTMVGLDHALGTFTAQTAGTFRVDVEAYVLQGASGTDLCQLQIYKNGSVIPASNPAAPRLVGSGTVGIPVSLTYTGNLAAGDTIDCRATVTGANSQIYSNRFTVTQVY